MASSGEEGMEMEILKVIGVIILFLFALGYKVYQYINFSDMAEASDRKEAQQSETEISKDVSKGGELK